MELTTFANTAKQQGKGKIYQFLLQFDNLLEINKSNIFSPNS